MECLSCPQCKDNRNAINAINNFDEPFDEEDKNLLLNKPLKAVKKPGSLHESVEYTTLLHICNRICNQFPGIENSVISIPSSFVPKKEKSLKTNETDKDVLELFSHQTRMIKNSIRQHTSTKLEAVSRAMKPFDLSKQILNSCVNALSLNKFELFKKTSKETQKRAHQKLKSNIEKYIQNHKEFFFEDFEEIIVDCLTEFILFDNKDLQQKWTSYTAREGQKSEQYVAQKICELLGDRPAFVLVGYRVWAFLHPLLQGLGITLRHAKDKNKDVEHDILALVPTESEIEVIFIEVKCSVSKPWKEQKHNETKFSQQLNHALHQTSKDIETFFDIASILIKDSMKKLSVRFFAVLPDWEFHAKSSLCESCSKVVITKADLGNKKNLTRKLKIPTKSKCYDSEIFTLYKILVGIYGGLGSLVPLKTAKEGYKLERACLRSVKEQYKSDALSDAYLILSLEQQDILRKRLHSYCMIGPYGGGKSLILELEILRMVREWVNYKHCLLIYICTGSRNYRKLLDYYQDMAKDLTAKYLNVRFRVASIEELWYENCECSIESLPKSTIYNILTEKLTEKHKDVCLMVDESIPTHPGIYQNPSEASGHFTLLKDSKMVDWTSLTPHPRCRLIMAVRTQSIINFFVENGTISEGTSHKSKIPTLVLKRDFRHSKRIKDFLSFVCEQSHFYRSVRALPLHVEQYGHEVNGDLPVWYQVPEKEHFICKDYPCTKCFLPFTEEIITTIMNSFLQEDLPTEDITVLVDLTSSSELHLVQKWLKKIHPDISLLSQVEATGLDIPIVVALHNRGKYFELTEMWSRACSRLVIVGPDLRDTQVLNKAAQDRFLKRIRFKSYKHPEVGERKWSLSSMEVSIKHLPISDKNVEPVPPKPLTRSRMISWSLSYLKEITVESEEDNKRTRQKR